MKLKTTVWLGAMIVAGAPVLAQAQSQAQPPASPSVSTSNIGSDAPDSRAINQLQLASQKLRDAVQAMAQQPAGERRNRAIKEANEALLEVKQAVASLPPQLRSKSATGSPSPRVAQGATGSVDHTKSMDRLQEAAQRLREAAQAMAQQPAGERRNNAMVAVNEALYDTEQAMISLPPELRLK